MQKSIGPCLIISLMVLFIAKPLAHAETTGRDYSKRSSVHFSKAQTINISEFCNQKLLAQAASKAAPSNSTSKAPQSATEEKQDCRTLVLLNYKLRQMGDYQSAEKVLQTAAKVASTDADRILVHNALGGLYMHTQNDLESEVNFRKALALLEKTAKPDSLDMATILDNLSVVCSSAKKFAEAESLNGRAIEIYRKNKNAPNATLDLITVLGNRGFILSRQGRHKESLASYEEAVAICQSGEQVPPSLYATMMDNLGSAYYMQGEFEKAEHARVDALALFESSAGQNHPETIKARRNLAAVYIKEGRLEDASDLLKKSIEALEKSGTVNKNLLNSCISDFQYCQIHLAAKKIKMQKQTENSSERLEEQKKETDKSADEGKPHNSQNSAAPASSEEIRKADER
jgi:tetratricopeptide (TPR) repeat protein